MHNFVVECFLVILTRITTWLGYLIGKTGEGMSTILVNWIFDK